MAQVFAKIFQSKKYQHGGQNSRHHNKSNTKWHINRFTKEHINLVLFKDCAKTGKQPILDSRCIRKLTLDDILCEKCRKQRRCARRSCPNCPGTEAAKNGSLPKYKNVCTSSGKNDIKMVGEMVFGTAPLASTGTTIKVHSLRSPHQLMLSMIFQYKRGSSPYPSGADFDSLDSFESSIYGDGLPRKSSETNLSSLGSSNSQSIASSRPVDMPFPSPHHHGSNTSLNASVTSGGSLVQTPLPSPGATSSASINSASNLNRLRRIRYAHNRSFQCNSLSTGSTTGSGGDSPQPSLSEYGGSIGCSRRKGPRIGMAVIFTLDEFDDSRRDFETFFFSHITLIEGQLMGLKSRIEKGAAASSSNVTQRIMEALEEFQNKVYDLYTAQRLANPVWLSMMASTTQKYKICERFVREFTILIDRYDTKSTNYFVSSLLTGVLMHHLAWVPTVTPSGETHSSYADKHSAKWLDMLAKSHPYNPLWAQLSDMYGAIGMPPRLARTIVTGKKVDTIIKFLFVLSYFIRCSEIHETLDECYDEENLARELESAVADDICLESMEKDATASSEFVLVDAPSSSIFMQDAEGSDSGLLSHDTSASRERHSSSRRTGAADTESGFTEPDRRGILADVSSVPASSPADKVREWISSSQLHDVDVSTPKASTNPVHRSTTGSTLVSSTGSAAALTPMESNSPVKLIQCLAPPTEVRPEVIRPVHRAVIPSTLPEALHSGTKSKHVDKPFNRRNLVRLFSSEIKDEEFDEYFDGKPPCLSRQNSDLSTSQFDEYFDDDNLDSFSNLFADEGGPTEVLAAANSRNVLFKVVKESGFHQHGQASVEGKTPVTKTVSNTTITQSVISPTTPTIPAMSASGSTVDEIFRPRNLSVGKQSSRCSTPQTIKGGANTPCPDGKCRHLSACPTTCLGTEPDPDPFSGYEELNMPRSTNISKLADTSISTTSFGRQQLASFSDHYLSDFVLHGTSDDDVIPKVQKDLVSSVSHSVLDDRISEAVCVVADTERWSVSLCSSMREQPKPLAASHLVMAMVETVSNLAKLRMSPEFILMHMEDRLQEMFFKSRMLSEYIKSRKKVDMDELDAMFGMETSDIKFLLSVSATHSTVNVHGIY